MQGVGGGGGQVGKMAGLWWIPGGRVGGVAVCVDFSVGGRVTWMAFAGLCLPLVTGLVVSSLGLVCEGGGGGGGAGQQFDDDSW